MPHSSGEASNLDPLIEVHRALARQNRERRDRAETAATTLMTTAATLGAVTVAASHSAGRLDTVPEIAVYVGLAALLATFLVAGLSRVGAAVGGTRNAEVEALRVQVENSITRLRGPVPDEEAQTTILGLWSSWAERDWLVSRNQWALVRLSSLGLVLAVVALALAGFWVVGSSS